LQEKSPRFWGALVRAPKEEEDVGEEVVWLTDGVWVGGNDAGAMVRAS